MHGILLIFKENTRNPLMGLAVLAVIIYLLTMPSYDLRNDDKTVFLPKNEFSYEAKAVDYAGVQYEKVFLSKLDSTDFTITRYPEIKAVKGDFWAAKGWYDEFTLTITGFFSDGSTRVMYNHTCRPGETGYFNTTTDYDGLYSLEFKVDGRILSKGFREVS